MAGMAFNLRVSDPAAQGMLERLLREVDGVRVRRERLPPEAGRLGGGELLQVAVPTLALLAVVVRTLPDFIRSRKNAVSVTVETDGRKVTVTTENCDDVDAIMKRLNGDD